MKHDAYNTTTLFTASNSDNNTVAHGSAARIRSISSTATTPQRLLTPQRLSAVFLSQLATRWRCPTTWRWLRPPLLRRPTRFAIDARTPAIEPKTAQPRKPSSSNRSPKLHPIPPHQQPHPPPTPPLLPQRRPSCAIAVSRRAISPLPVQTRREHGRRRLQQLTSHTNLVPRQLHPPPPLQPSNAIAASSWATERRRVQRRRNRRPRTQQPSSPVFVVRLPQSTRPLPPLLVAAATCASRPITSHPHAQTKTDHTPPPLVPSRLPPAPVVHPPSNRATAATPPLTPPSTAPYPSTATTASRPPTSPPTAPTSAPYSDSANERRRRRAIGVARPVILNVSVRHCHIDEYGDRRGRSVPWAVMCVAASSTTRWSVRR